MRGPGFIRPARLLRQQGRRSDTFSFGRAVAEIEAAAVLGRSHPIVRALELRRCVRRQAWTTGLVTAGGIFGLAAGWPGAEAVTATGASVLAAFALATVVFRRLVARGALDLILEGRECLPITAVRAERQRLLSCRARGALARRFDAILYEAWNPPRIPVRGTRPLVDSTVARRLTPELRAAAQMLRRNQSRAAPVALVERLLTDGASPLYGHEIAPLRTELHRLLQKLSRTD